MNGGSLPSYDQAISGMSNTNNAVGGLTTDVQNLAPYAQTYHSQTPTPALPTYQAPKSASASQGVLPAFWGKVESVGKETASLTGEAGKWIGTQIVNAAAAPAKFATGIGNAVSDWQTADNLQKQTQELTTQQDSLMQSYKSGLISKADYLKGLNDLSKQNLDLSNKISNFQSQNSIDQKNMVIGAIGTETDVLALMAGGLGAALKAPAMIAENSAAASALSSSDALIQGANIITKLASSEEDWAALSPLAQNAMRVATTQAMQAATTYTTGTQLARAAAADLLLRFPLYFNAINTTGQQIYSELNQGKYGDAVKTLAFNAALLFSGGPIGWGLKQAGKVGDGIITAMGLRPSSILDELSSQVGNGDRLALDKIAQEQIRQGNTSEVKAMIIGLESNLKAANGNAAFAVNQIIDHLQNYVGWGDMKNMTHQELWDNMVNYWKHADGLEQLKSEGKIEGIAANDPRTVVPGRFSTFDKNAIAEAVTQGDLSLSTGNLEKGQQTVQDRLNAWEQFKAQYPNAAFANNPNVDKQITHLIQTTEDPEALHKAINNIKTQFGLEGIPQEYADKMAKDGYIAIIPTSHNLPVVPFGETSQKLTTGADTLSHSGWFTKAAPPVPVLQSVGKFLTWAGLSPEAAGQRVQDLFTQNFNEAAKSFSFLSQDTSKGEQDILPRIYEYMKNPSGGLKVFGHTIPITDMRQLTTGDIQRALSVSKEEAKQVGDAIMQAYIDVPRQVTGLGNKILDMNFKVNPLASPFSRVQGAARFSWNPIFTQARLPLKAEFLAQMETGGKFPTIAGTNRFMSVFFPGQYKELNAIVDNPDFKSIVGGGLGGEAEASTTGIGDIANLPPKTTLLPVAGLVKSMADNAGMDAATFMQQQPQAVHDAVQALLHYDQTNSFLNSPLAKTLNMAFFPFRFNVKVAGFMANFLAKQPPAIQYAAIHGIMNAKTFLQSPQGQAWYAQHSDVIGLFKYFSPLETVSSISAILTHPDTISSYGELGGLPFGWIPQATDAAGLTHFGSVYVNPRTGAIAQDYVPTSAYGALNAAIQDLLGALFTYPGATAGFPSKGSVERRVVGGLLPGSNKDFTTVNPTPSAQDTQFSQIAAQANGAAPQPQNTANTTTPPVQSFNVSPQKSPQPTQLPTRSGTKRMKKSDYKPYLLPGQTQLGQL